MGRLEGTGCGGKVGGPGIPGEVGVARAVHSDARAYVLPAAPEIRRVNQSRSRGVELGREGVAVASTVGWLEGTGSDRKVSGLGIAGDVSVAHAVHGDAIALVPRAAATEIGGVNQSRARGIKLRHECVAAATSVGWLEGAGRDRKVGDCSTGDVSIARAVHGDAVPPTAFAEIGGVNQG